MNDVVHECYLISYTYNIITLLQREWVMFYLLLDRSLMSAAVCSVQAHLRLVYQEFKTNDKSKMTRVIFTSCMSLKSTSKGL